jgi:RNA exonuclease NGL2
MTYTALTQRPIQLTPYQEEELHGSVTYDFRQVKDEEEELAEDNDLTPAGAITPADNTDIEVSNTDSNATDSSTTPIWKTREYLTQRLLIQEEKPLNITPASMENNALVLEHHSSNPPLKSLYSAGLKLCQSDNAVNGFGEPPFTNWAHGYKETLDYIFVLDDQLTEEKVRLSALLKMPRKEEMKEGEPQEGRFPSDHVCEMVEVELL